VAISSAVASRLVKISMRRTDTPDLQVRVENVSSEAKVPGALRAEGPNPDTQRPTREPEITCTR
jgi:hypothetical protein